MQRALQLKFALAAMVIGATSGSAQVNSKYANMATVVRPSDAFNRSLAIRVDQQVSHLPPSAITTIVPAPPPSAPAPGGGGPVEPPTPPPAEQPRLEYVQAPGLDAAATHALAGQADIKKVIGSQGKLLALPGFVRQVDPTGDDLQLKMIALAGGPLTFDKNLNSFVGTMWLGVNEIVGGPSRKLVKPVEFKVLNAKTAEPATVSITSTGAIGYEKVRLAMAAAFEAPKVNVASNLAQEPFDLPVPIRPALLISRDTPIDGLGLATSTVNVTALGLPERKGSIIFQKSAGSLSDKRVNLDADGTASTDLRSDGLGVAKVDASLAGVMADTVDTTVQFGIPYFTIIASIVGGIVGGLIRVGMSGIRGRRAKVTLGVAVLVGIVVFGLYAVGVNVLPIDPLVKVGAVFVFVVSAVGAFIGPSVLPKGG